jgi:hypothetical protein
MHVRVRVRALGDWVDALDYDNVRVMPCFGEVNTTVEYPSLNRLCCETALPADTYRLSLPIAKAALGVDSYSSNQSKDNYQPTQSQIHTAARPATRSSSPGV